MVGICPNLPELLSTNKALECAVERRLGGPRKLKAALHAALQIAAQLFCDSAAKERAMRD